MKGAKFIESIRLENILSFGPNSEPFSLEPLNVFIGPNASGKSNFIEALSLLHAAPTDLQDTVRRGGGVREWLWKGNRGSKAAINVTLSRRRIPAVGRLLSIKYELAFSARSDEFWLLDELVEREDLPSSEDVEPSLYYSYNQGNATINIRAAVDSGYQRRLLSKQDDPAEWMSMWGDLPRDQSILSQRHESFSFPELSYVGGCFRRIDLHRHLSVGPHSRLRYPQSIDLPQDALNEDASNLALVLNRLLNEPPVKERFLRYLRAFYPSFTDVTTFMSGGTMQINFHERGLPISIPAVRLSDGSLRFLWLLAVLCDPRRTSRVICIEEPEVGLHPDVIPEVAKLLIETSQTSQLFITTHSDVLVDALTEVPEAVVVCEKRDGATQLNRLDANDLKSWLDDYRLGEVWMRGAIGGTR